MLHLSPALDHLAADTTTRHPMRTWLRLSMHFAVMTIIALSLYVEGGKTADWSFLLLSLLTEVQHAA